MLAGRLCRRRDHHRCGSNQPDRQRSPAVSCHDVTPSPRPRARTIFPRRSLCDTRRLQRFTPGSEFCNVLLRARHDGRGQRPAQARRGRRRTRRRRVPEHGVQRLQPARAALTRPARARAAHRGRARLRRARSRRAQPAQRSRRRDRRRLPPQPRRRLRRAGHRGAPARPVRRHRPAPAGAGAGARPAGGASVDRAGGRQRRRRRPDRVLDGRRRSALPRGAAAAAAHRDRRLAGRRRPGGDRQRAGERPIRGSSGSTTGPRPRPPCATCSTSGIAASPS